MAGGPFPMVLLWYTLQFGIPVAGIIIAAARFRQHPAVSGLVMAGLAILLLGGLFSQFVVPRLPLWLADRGVPVVSVVERTSAYLAGLRAAGIALLLVAAFGWRRPG